MSEEEGDPEVQHQEDEQPPEEPKNILKAEQIIGGLSQISKSLFGVTYAYTSLNLEEKELEELGALLRGFQHLKYVTIAKNTLKDISEVLNLENLLTLNASENQISDISFLSSNPDQLQYLQILNLNKNKLVSLPRIPQVNLSRLIMSENEIADCSYFSGHYMLQSLDLSKNKLTHSVGICSMPNLKELDLSENEISDPSGFYGFDSIKKINLSKNKLTTLDNFPLFPTLEHLMVVENQIAELSTIENLKKFYNLRQIDMNDNPAASEKGDDFKKEVLIKLAQTNINLKKINDDEITADDIKDALNEKQERIKAEEAARKEAEENAKREAEERAAAIAEGGEVPVEVKDEE